MWNIETTLSRLHSRMFRVKRSMQLSPRNLRTIRHVFSEQVLCCQNWWAETSFCLELTSSLPALQRPEASIFFSFGSNHCNNIDFQEQSSDLANTTSHCVHILLRRIYVFVIPFLCRCYNSGLGSRPADRAGSHLPLRLRSACRVAPGTSSSVSMKAAQHSAAHDCPTACCRMSSETAPTQEWELQSFWKGQDRQHAGLLRAGTLQNIPAPLS